MGATTSRDKARLSLEDVIGSLVVADEHLRVALLKMVQWARTDYEADIMAEMVQARKEIRKARNHALEYHPDSRENGKEKR